MKTKAQESMSVPAVLDNMHVILNMVFAEGC